MRKLFLIAALLVVFILVVVRAPSVFATSSQAYQDYLYQYDVYRQIDTEFQVAKNEYEKFKSLSAQSDALAKAKLMLNQRDLLLRSYLLLIKEKVLEDQGISTSNKQLYQSLIQNEIVFLENHASLIPAAGSIDDATRVSEELESHYTVLQASIRQMLIGLSLGQLTILSRYYDKAVTDAQKIITLYGTVFSPTKQETINRWLLQITNKRSFYQQKYDAIVSANSQMAGTDKQQLEEKYSAQVKNIAEARQYLLEGSSFFIELTNALKYIE